jgi:hypothetical protein
MQTTERPAVTAQSGVYVIRHCPSGRVYVGSSRNIATRWANHRATLNSGRHGNRGLQADWARDGAAAFEFLVVEPLEVDDPSLEAAEQRWAAHYQLLGGGLVYNRRPVMRPDLSPRAKDHMEFCPRTRAQITALMRHLGQPDWAVVRSAIWTLAEREGVAIGEYDPSEVNAHGRGVN